MGLLVIPAIDLYGGRCVRLTRGDYATATTYSDDPLEMVARFASAGCERIHVVDLDAARGDGDNGAVIERMLQSTELQLQVAGGVRSLARVEALLDRGAHFAVMGTAAVNDPRLFEHCAHRHPDRLLAALDVRGEQPAVGGWLETSPLMIGPLVRRWDRLPLAGVIVTSIDRDGTMTGPELQTLTRVRKMTGLPLQYSGGVGSLEQLPAVEAAGAQAVILGKAIYEGRIDLADALAR